ncbi:MAG: hypothetical protein CSA24_00735 [Deltaproteobacteria bacterium]|nr:MAG: hypothetical protein CSA24_00735 [Deltaproteobacteria bacterium]
MIASLVLFAASTAHADKKVLVARPGLAPGLTDAQKRSIRDGMYRGLTAAKAYAVDEGDIDDEMKRAGVTSLVSRAASLKVARQIEAYAVLRYQAKPIGDKVKVRVTVVTTDKDSLVFRDLFVPSERLENRVEAVTRALVGGAARGGAANSGEASGSVASGSAKGDAPSPLVQRPLHEPDPFVASGFVFEAHVAGSVPGGGNASEVLSVGFQAGANVGWQLGIGSFQSITPQLVFGFSSWSLQDGVVLNPNNGAIPVTGSANMLNVLVGARYTLHLGAASVWTGFALGFGRLAARLENNAGTSYDDDTSGFALQWELGGHYMLTRWFGVGGFIGVMKSFVAKRLADGFGGQGFTFGLSLRTKL